MDATFFEERKEEQQGQFVGHCHMARARARPYLKRLHASVRLLSRPDLPVRQGGIVTAASCCLCHDSLAWKEGRVMVDCFLRL